MAKEIVIDIKTLGTEEANRQIERLKAGLDATDDSVNKTTNSISDLEEELETMRNTLKGLDVNSDEFAELASKIAMADSELKDLNKTFEGLDADAKAGELGKLAGGLGAIGTAAALAFGDNEDVEAFFETFAKGLAITNAAKGAIEVYTSSTKLMRASTVINTVATTAASAAQAAYTTVVGTSTGALKLFRLALAATGIGAIVVLIGALIANFSELTDWVQRTIKRFKFLQDAVQPLIRQFEQVKAGLQALGIIDDAETEKTIKNSEDKIEQYDKEKIAVREKARISIAAAQGEASEIAKINKEVRDGIILRTQLQIEEQKKIVKATGEFTDEQRKQLEQWVNDIKELRIQQFEADQALEAKANEDKLADNKAYLDKKAKNEEEARKAELKRISEEEEEARQLRDLKVQALEDGLDKERQILDNDFKDKIQKAKERFGEETQVAVQLEKDRQVALSELQKEFDDNRLAAEREAADKKMALQLELKMLMAEAGLEDPNATPEELMAAYEMRAEAQAEIDALELQKADEDFENELITREERDLIRAQQAQRAAEREMAIDETVIENKRALRDAVIDSAAGTVNAIASLFKENVGLQKAALIVDGAVAVAKVVINTMQGNAAALAQGIVQAGPIAGPAVAAPAIAANNIMAGASIAGIVAAKAAAFASLGGGGGGGGGAKLPAPPSTSASTPGVDTQTLFSTQNLEPSEAEEFGTGPGVRQETVKAVVVEMDITETQDRLSTYSQRSEIG